MDFTLLSAVWTWGLLPLLFLGVCFSSGSGSFSHAYADHLITWGGHSNLSTSLFISPLGYSVFINSSRPGFPGHLLCILYLGEISALPLDPLAVLLFRKLARIIVDLMVCFSSLTDLSLALIGVWSLKFVDLCLLDLLLWITHSFSCHSWG